MSGSLQVKQVPASFMLKTETQALTFPNFTHKSHYICVFLWKQRFFLLKFHAETILIHYLEFFLKSLWGWVKAVSKYLVEITLVVNAKDIGEARKIADYLIDLPIPDKEIENKIETLRIEEIVQITDQKPR